MTVPQFGGGYSPGIRTETLTFGAMPEFLASEHYMVKSGAVTLDAAAVTADGDGNKIVRAGQPLYRQASTGKYRPAPAGGASGDDLVCKGLLFAGDLNLRYGDVAAGLLIHGSVKEARCPTISSQVKTDVKGQIIFQ